MSVSSSPQSSYDTQCVSRTTDSQPVRLTTETKSAFKTTELIVYVLSVVGVLVASAVVDATNNGNANADGFGAQQAWFLVTLLTIGYLISRGLAKSGSRERYTA
jgi:hypothetical protein